MISYTIFFSCQTVAQDVRGDCLERCPVHAISMIEESEVNRDICLGCGLCTSTCPTESIILRLRPDREEPFARVVDMGMAILDGKAKRNG